jgi:hypothetical protein
VDTANLAFANTAYTVTISPPDLFDIDTLNIGGKGATPTTLLIEGALNTSTIAYADDANGSLIDVANGGELIIRNAITAGVAETISISGSGAGGLLELGDADFLGINVKNALVTLSFTPVASAESAGVIEFNGPEFRTGETATQAITGVEWGDTFVFDHANFTGDTVLYNALTKVLTVETPGLTTVLTMNNVAADAGTTFAAFGDVIAAVCYARGTMLRTPDGELPVEKLRAGKQVITLVDGQEVSNTVVWLGHRRINIAGHPRPETVAPIRIQRNAFAEGVPHRDLIVSPDHAIFVDGKLICARQLVNGSTIRQEGDWTAVDYYHVELESHAILLAEGLPAESYIDTGNSGFFENSDAPLVLHPDLTDESDYPAREAGSCAPFVWDEASVRPIWQRLADRAATIGQPIPRRAVTTEAYLRLRGKLRDRLSKPIYADSNLAIFVLPRGATQVHLLSQAQSPTEARPWLDDRRRLGVRVRRIVLRGANELREVPMDHPDLTKGWWGIERDGQMMSRWTDGDAVVPLPKMDGHVMLEVHLAGEMIYAADTEVPDTERAAA